DTAAPNADPADPHPPLVPALILGFHRLDLRLYHGSGALDSVYRVVGGYDRTLSAGSDVTMWVLEPSARWRIKAAGTLNLVAGLEGTLHDMSQNVPAFPPDEVSLQTLTKDLKRLYIGSALTEALWRPTRRWLIRPGVRADVLNDGTTTDYGIDPRVS